MTASNKYTDTRGNIKNAVDFSQAVVDGMACGGGLYVPEEIPKLSLEEILALAKMPYAKRAAFVYKAFNTDIDSTTIDALMQKAYGENFDDNRICPISHVGENAHVLELWHGPTSAFKDMALQCLPLFFSASAKKLHEEGKLDHNFMILVATSGDTGKAALEGFRDVAGIRIGVMYPHGGVSDIQWRQMATQLGGNVCVWGVRGNFDDCQTSAKTIFDDSTFAKQLLAEHNVALSSANSINWGRLLPQVVYYVSAYAQLVSDGSISAGNSIDVCVPTGNFGNILAAFYAKQMGVPIDKLLCASNENCVLSDFINTGTYDISNRQFVQTPSPSMDILVSSNLERQLFELTGRNASAINTWMNDLKTNKSFKVDSETFNKITSNLKACSVTNKNCLHTIKQVFETHNYLLDPHTAVAWRAAEELRGNNPVLIASTAHWAKFGNNVYRALHDIAPGAALPSNVDKLTGCELNSLIAKETGKQNIPHGLAELNNMPIRFEEIIDNNVESIKSAVASFLEQKPATK